MALRRLIGVSTLPLLLAVPHLLSAASHFTPPALQSAQGVAVAFGDFDGDNKLDIVSVTPGQVSVQQGSGLFATTVLSPTDFVNPTYIAVGDVDGDGKQDLVVVSGGGFVNILLGSGNATFPTLKKNPAPSPIAVALGDFNGDHIIDLAVTNLNGTISIFLGTGGGNFANPVNYAAGNGAPIVVGDFNGDNKLDIATLNGINGAALVLLGNGNGTFQNPLTSTANGAAISPYSLAAADFDGNGKLDLAIADPFNRSVDVLLGKGDGTFNAPALYATGNGSESVAAADLDGDGKQDLAVGNLSDNNISVLTGGAAGVFQAAVNYTVPAPSSVLVGDFNGDTLPDLFVGSSSTGAVNILFGSNIVVTAGSGTPQNTTIGTAFANPLTVNIMNGLFPVTDGTTVTFAAPATGASAVLSSTTAVTTNGNASITATANNTAGTYNVTATYQGQTVNFVLTNNVGAPANISAAGGSSQVVLAGQPFPVALQASVTDAGGNPLSGVTVTFAAPASGAGATLSSTTATTNASGIASVMATANGTVGSYTVSATVGALSVLFLLTNNTSQTTSITSTGGTPQTTSVNTAFAGALSAVVKNSAGTAVTGATVTFNVPSSGPSAILSANTAVTDASGSVSVTARANGQVGAYTVTASVGGVGGEGAATAIFSLTNTAGPPSSITPTGTPQSAIVGAQFAAPLTVTLKDAGNNPLSGVTVTFSAPASGASAALSATTVVTGAAGTASVTATANGTSGSYTVSATAGGLTTTFSLTNSSSPTGGLTATGGTPQSTITGTPFAVPLQATLRDSSGNPMSGVVVTFTAPASGASATLSSSSAITSASGIASVTATANSIAGSYAVTATAGALSTSFSLTNATGSGINLTASAGTPQSAVVGNSFPVSLQVTVRDAFGNTANGVTVTFAAPSTGASASLSSTTASSNSAGIASVTATANNTVGSYNITATAGGVTVNFALTNTSGQALNITASSGATQSISIGTPFPLPLQATVKDAFGNTIGGVTVTFTAPSSGASAVLSSATAVTNGNGVASVSATANGTAGSYTVTASTGGVSAGFSLTNISGGGSDLALGKTATQSSTLAGYSTTGPSGAVDGNTDGNFFDGSVTHTNQDANAWWQVDLGGSFNITSINIFGRTDCCGSRLGDYWVFVSDQPFLATDTPATLQSRAGTFSSHQTSAPNPSTSVMIAGAEGRYVRIQLSGTNFLSLAEVQVTGTPNAAGSNIALGGTASQSSTLSGYSTTGARSAIDNNTDGNFFDGSVSHTNQDANAWWQVDLGSNATVNSVAIFNRTDCCSDRLSDFWVFVSNTPFLATDTPATLQNRAGTFSSHQTTMPNPSTTITTGGVQGRYVRVQLSGTNFLSLAEVQVFGTPGNVTNTNLALNKAASQSSTLAAYATTGAGSAVDGNTDGNFFDGSVSHTNQDANAWWQVDLGASSSVSSIVVWNRTDCCGDRLGDFWVFVSDTPFQASDTPTTLQNRAATFSSHQTAAPNPSSTITIPGAQGRYVRVQLSGTNFLSLAEVQVIGTASQ